VTAASHGDLPVLERALAGEFSDRLDNDDINEALLRAACHGQVECLKTLLRSGADPDCEDLDGDTPLMLAASNNFVGKIHAL
jgi:ankyrin repeat protein